MLTFQYNSSIVINAAKGFKFGGRMPMEKDGQLFIDYVTELLDTINGSSLGARMFGDMRATGKTCTIWYDADRNGSAAVMAVESPASDRARFIKPFRPPSHQMLAGWARMEQKPQAPGSTWTRAVAKGPYLEELTAILDRAAAGGLKRGQVAALIGRSESYLAAAEAGQQAIDDDDYFKLAYTLYAFLTPGPGTDTAIRFDADKRPTHEGKKPQGDWSAPVPHVDLAHELIHALRMMQGLRVANGLWGEESMTVGLPPFTTLPYTENKFRVIANVALRTNYGQSSTGTKSGWLDRLASQVETIGGAMSAPAKSAPASGWKRANPRI